MALARRTKTGLWIGGVAAAVALVLWLLPIGMRWGAVKWLEDQGLSAEIADVDFNPFTGRLAVTDARAEHPDGDGFEISSLSLNLQYWPLFSKQLYLAELTVGKGRIDAVRTEDNAIRIAGLTLGAGGDEEEADESDGAWGFGLDRADIEALTLHYRSPDFERSVTLASSTAADVATWRTDRPIPVNADLNVGDAAIDLQGELQPFGSHVTGDFDLAVQDFALNVVAPLAERAGVAQLAGAVSVDLGIGLDYRADSGLTLDTDGTVSLQGTRLKIPQVRIDGGDLDWDGKLHAELLRTGEDEPTLLSTDGTLELSGADLTVPDTLVFTQGSARWQGQTETRLTADGPRIDAEGSLDGKELDAQVPPANLNLALAELAWQGQTGYAPAGLNNEGKLSLGGVSLSLPEAKLDASGESLQWDGRLAFGMGAGESEAPQPAFEADGTLTGTAIGITDTGVGRTLARAESLEARQIEARGANEVDAERIAAQELRALARAADAPRTDSHPYIVSLERLALAAPSWRGGNRLTVDRADVNGLNALVLRGAEGEWEFAPWLRGGGEESGEPSEVTFAIGEIAVGDGSALDFDDRAVSPSFATRLSELEATMTGLDSGAPSEPAEFDLTSAIGRYGDLSASGQARAFQDKLSLEATAGVNALNLSPLSGYLVRAVDRSVAQGTLSSDAKLAIDRDALDGEIELTLNKFRLGPAPEGQGAAEARLGLPLDQALGLLRDGDGNIGFTLPVGGDLTNPEFSFLNVVQKAILKGVQTAVLAYYSPLGVLKVADKLVDLATALDFKPVVFNPGEAELDGDDRDYLNKVAELLGKRPEVQFVVCGRAVPDDRPALELPPADSEEAGEQALAEARDRLLELARSRTEAVGDFLIDRGIGNDRLVLCNPTLDGKADAVPRTTVSF